ncbi:MAG: UDP-glucose 4-epimerase GalE [Desulfovibrio sp.]|uniref:UDP-glucose 4-epimerase GalE n=1 Tax=Desulfovibrio sp. TaxID=885 RepID=UPI001A67C23F|nr:UDP-glucose 4-epimerase GalE [Desulfovibrio sp.]MBD5417942.1 UDP-glucose 4-epimerase GalE [Desulfovibrio sp.]
MRICVTGGAGYIGSHACKALAEAGHEVIVYDNLSTGHRRFVRWGPFCHGDIRDTVRFRACLREFRPDGIIHFAASAYVGESVMDPGKYFSNNVGGTLSILEAMRDEGCPAIVVSGTCAVYGQPGAVPIAETCPPNPINPYGASKLFMERMLADFATAHSLRWMSLRYFNAAGSSAQGEIGELHEPETHLIPRVMFAALGIIDAIDIFGTDYPTPDGTCVRDYIHVEDLARAHIRALERLLAGGENMALNLGTERGASVREIIQGVAEIAGRMVPCRDRERRSGDPAILVADAARAREVLDWSAQKNLSSMLQDAWSFFAAQKGA